MTDGLPIDSRRGGAGNCFRLVVSQKGFLDIVDMGHQPGGPHYWQLNLNGLTYWYDGDGSITLTINNDGTFNAKGDGNDISGHLLLLPQISDTDVALFREMLARKIVPYQNIPDAPGKPEEEIRNLGQQFFPYTENSFELAMSIYDWTTADFARIVFFKIFVYTRVEGNPLDKASIANAIWTSSWSPYTPDNADYMNSFMMTPAHNLDEVVAQLNEVAPQLYQYNQAENNILTTAFLSMPRTSTLAKPHLYSGQVDISNLGTEHFATEFLEFPGNAGPVSNPLQMPLQEALSSFIQVGKTITTKMVWSFTDSIEDAMHYQNGILLIANPPEGAVLWDCANYVTPLSDDPNKTEYTFPPNTQFMIQKIEQKTIQEKNVWEITLRVVRHIS
jgi:hypothetical protein